jgi:hypothetical protein
MLDKKVGHKKGKNKKRDKVTRGVLKYYGQDLNTLVAERPPTLVN